MNDPANSEGDVDAKSKGVGVTLSAYRAAFEKACPYYLSIGMTATEYWDGDPSLPKYFRKAQELRNQIRNQELWLQGMYVYEAIADVAPILQAFAKKGAKPRPYPDKPYAITDKEVEAKAEARQKAIADKGKRLLDALQNRANKVGEMENADNRITGTEGQY